MVITFSFSFKFKSLIKFLKFDLEIKLPFLSNNLDAGRFKELGICPDSKFGLGS